MATDEEKKLRDKILSIQTEQEQMLFGETEYSDEDKDSFSGSLAKDNFAKLYAWAVEKNTPASEEQLATTSGEWKKYPKGSDPMPLVRSLQGHGTGWCSAGESTASAQLKTGDFWVYYSLDSEGKPVIPRAAIRMERNKIAEVRGISSEQNLDGGVVSIVEEKLNEFADGRQYQKRVGDMHRLTEIERKTKKEQRLSKEDLRFLYEIDFSIEGFGYQKDPRIKDILSGRHVRDDLIYVFGTKPERISLNKNEALRGNIVFHYGNLYLRGLTSAEGLNLPDSIGGYLDLGGLTFAERSELRLKYPNLRIIEM